MSPVGFVIMVVAGLGAVVGLRQAKAGVAWGRPVAVGCTLLVLALAAVAIIHPARSGKRVETIMDRYAYASGEVLGSHLAEGFPGSRALILLSPGAQDAAEASFYRVEEAQLEGLKAGLATALEVVDAVPIEPPDSLVGQLQAMGLDAGSIDFEVQNYRAWFSARSLAENLARHQETYDVVISCVGLPVDFTASRLASGSLPSAFAALNVSPSRIDSLVEKGVLDAVVVEKPVPRGGWAKPLKAPSNTAKAFEERYVLITPGNVEDVAATYPSLFR